MIGSLIFNIILLPKSCNENPETPIMKLEYQIQEWWNSKSDYYETFGFGFVGCFLFIITNSMPVFILKKSTRLALGTILMISTIVFMYSTILERELIFKDSSDSCKTELTRISYELQFGASACVVISVLSDYLMCLFRCLKSKY